MAKTKDKEEPNSILVSKNDAQLPAEFASELEEYAAQHDYKDFGADDVITPRISILQTGSKPVKKQRPEYISGAEAGMFLNTATKEVYDGGKGILVVPCAFNKEWTEWRPVDAGGGLVKRWGDDESFKNFTQEEKGRWLNHEQGTEIVQSANYYVLVINEETGTISPAIFSLAGTQFKKSRGWGSLITQQDYLTSKGEYITPPPFFKAYRLTTIPESNESGDWFGVRVSYEAKTFELPNGKAIWNQAKEFRSLVMEGKVKVTSPDEREEVESNDQNGRI